MIRNYVQRTTMTGKVKLLGYLGADGICGWSVGACFATIDDAQNFAIGKGYRWTTANVRGTVNAYGCLR